MAKMAASAQRRKRRKLKEEKRQRKKISAWRVKATGSAGGVTEKRHQRNENGNGVSMPRKRRNNGEA